MKIVIDIPEDLYEVVKEDGIPLYKEERKVLADAIANGTPLPKGHGRLIDADYKVSSDGRTIDTVCGHIAPTIIEADKGEEK